MTSPIYKKVSKSSNVNDYTKPSFIKFCSELSIKSGGGVTPFKLYDYQKNFFNDLDKSSMVMVVKTRQMGFSEFICAYAVWEAVNNPGFSAAIFSKTQEDSFELSRRIITMVSSHPQLRLKGEALKRIEFEGGGSIKFLPSNRDSGRGLPSVSLIVFDECAFVDSLADLKTASLAATSMVKNKKVVYISTPNGTNGEFWNMLNSNNGESVDILTDINRVREGSLPPYHSFKDSYGFCKVIVHYTAHPVYSKMPNFLALKQKELNATEEQISQEFDLGFLSNNFQFFNSEDVLKNVDVNFIRYSTKERHTLMDLELVNGTWLHPHYVMTVDPSGQGSDYFCGVVIDIRTMPWKIIDWYYVKGKDYSREEHLGNLAQLIKRYRIKTIRYEVNGVGDFFHYSLSAALKALDVTGVNMIPVTTTASSKAVKLNELKNLLKEGKIRYPCGVPFLTEFQDIIQVGSKIHASGNNHDDFTMALSFSTEWSKNPPNSPNHDDVQVKQRRNRMFSLGCLSEQKYKTTERDPFLTFDSDWTRRR